jgi:hypothetical protein
MTTRATRLRALFAIGPMNGLRVIVYRLGLKLGIHPAQRIAASIPHWPFFAIPVGPPVLADTSRGWRDDALLFGAHRVPVDSAPPAWMRDPLGGGDGGNVSHLPWWRIPDFAAGDIKRVWELSRFDWAMTFAQRARNGDAIALERLNAWIADWAVCNPPYLGPNWKCAQEASIRLLHLSIAAVVLGQDQVLTDSLHALVTAHVKRIEPTLSYAQAQDNNHATSEAAALFVAGAWMGLAGKADATRLERKGRRLLERHVTYLFSEDGSFSQHSLNYHRVALDTLSIVEIWRRRAGLPPFSARLRARAVAAADWLRTMVDPDNGDAPNLGANDGANLLPLSDSLYRDYRPAVQLASALFSGMRAYPPGGWDGPLAWLDVTDPGGDAEPPTTAIFDDGGYVVLRREGAMALLRYPRFRFRPSQSDALHVDLWVNGENLLRDGGSYSYNSGERWLEYFGGVEAHNTVQFDDQPQMPRVSRFLLGDWLTTESHGSIAIEDGEGYYAAYRHRRGWHHRRQLELSIGSLLVVDDITGFSDTAILRWRLAAGNWVLDGTRLTNGRHCLSIEADVPIVRAVLVTGFESRHYLEMSELPVLEVTVAEPGKLVSEYRWAL